MTQEILWKIAASLQILIAVAHFVGTLYSPLLHPTDKNLIEKMKQAILQVDKRTTQWNAWIFFNIAFALCLLVVGVFSYVLAQKHFEILKGINVFSSTMILGSALTVFFAQKLAVRKVRTAFSIITLLYLTSILLEVL